MDRIDIHLEVPSVPYKDLSGASQGASSAEILERVVRAREIQSKRFHKTKIYTNARMKTRQITEYCRIDAESGALLEKAMDRFGLSARAHARILKIARTISDLEGIPKIDASHLAEAIQYRTLDRKIAK